MNEPGDWKQAVLQARGKTAAAMLQKRTADKTAKDKLDLDIRKKALDLYTASKAGNKPTATSLVGLVGKVTPASLAKYEKSGKLSDLVLISDTKDVGDLLKDFTAASVAKFQQSGDYNDLVGGRLPDSGNKGDTTKDLIELLDTYTAESIDAYKISNNFSDLVLKDASSWSPTVGNTTDAQQENDLKTMESVAFRENLKNAPPDVKLKRLRDYAALHAQTTKKINEKVLLGGDTLKQRTT
jgi:hypothetical protein